MVVPAYKTIKVKLQATHIGEISEFEIFKVGDIDALDTVTKEELLEGVDVWVNYNGIDSPTLKVVTLDNPENYKEYPLNIIPLEYTSQIEVIEVTKSSFRVAIPNPIGTFEKSASHQIYGGGGNYMLTSYEENNKLIYNFTNTQPNTLFRIVMTAQDAIEQQAQVEISVRTLDEVADTPPTFNNSLYILNTTTSSITLNWDEATKGTNNIKHYNIFVDNTLVDTITDLNYIVNNLTPDTEYNIKVEVEDTVGLKDVSSTVSIFTQETPIVFNNPVNVVSKTETSININWAAATEGSNPILNYEVFLDGTSQGTTTATSFTITGLEKNTTHNIVVTVSDGVFTVTSQTITVKTNNDCIIPSGVIEKYQIVSIDSGESEFFITTKSKAEIIDYFDNVFERQQVSYNTVASLNYAIGEKIYKFNGIAGQECNGFTGNYIYTAIPAYDNIYTLLKFPLTYISVVDGIITNVEILEEPIDPEPTDTVPNKVENLSLYDATQSTLTMQWGNSVGAIGYKVYLGGVLWETFIGNSQDYTVTVPCGGGWVVNVVAYNNIGDALPSDNLTMNSLECDTYFEN